MSTHRPVWLTKLFHKILLRLLSVPLEVLANRQFHVTPETVTSHFNLPSNKTTVKSGGTLNRMLQLFYCLFCILYIRAWFGSATAVQTGTVPGWIHTNHVILRVQTCFIQACFTLLRISKSLSLWVMEHDWLCAFLGLPTPPHGKDTIQTLSSKTAFTANVFYQPE